MNAACPIPKGEISHLKYMKTVLLVERGNDLIIQTKDCQKTTIHKKKDGMIGVTSSTHAYFLKKLGLFKNLKAVSNPIFHYELPKQNITSFGYPASIEKVVSSKVDFLFTYQPRRVPISTYQQVPIYEYLESHPLGRAEWIKVFGSIFELKDLANKIFSKIEKKYLKVQNGIRKRHRVLVATYRGGFFELPNKNGYLIKLFEDAGFDVIYPRKNITLVEALQLSGKIDFWFVHDIFNSLDQIMSYDKKIKLFIKKFNPRIFSPVARISSNGANDFFESGVLRADKILEELISFNEGTNKSYYYKELSR